MPKIPVKDVVIRKTGSNGGVESADVLAIEEPLEIRLTYGPQDRRQTKNISVTMRTPGNDPELATGFLFTEGIIRSGSQVQSVSSDPEDCGRHQDNIVNVSLTPGIQVDLEKLERHFYTSSSCGVCGKASIGAIRTITPFDLPGPDDVRINKTLFYRLPQLLDAGQEIFRSTGGLHASALFDLKGKLLGLREDIGRHNALDKLIGYFIEQLPLSGHILLLSGRASFELIQKAAMAGIKIVAAVGAPSSLAVQLAQEFDITLLGFLKKDGFNIYTGSQRVIL